MKKHTYTTYDEIVKHLGQNSDEAKGAKVIANSLAESEELRHDQHQWFVLDEDDCEGHIQLIEDENLTDQWWIDEMRHVRALQTWIKENRCHVLVLGENQG